MESKIDIYYKNEGIFITFFMGNSPDSLELYKSLLNQNDGSPKILAIYKQEVLKQIKKFGYSVKKLPSISESKKKEELNLIFEELTKLGL